MCCENCCECYSNNSVDTEELETIAKYLYTDLLKYREYFYLEHKDDLVDIFDNLLSKVKNLQYYLD